MKHSMLSPSSANRRMACPGSARLEAEASEIIEFEESEVAKEGTAAHWVAAIYLSGVEENEFRKALNASLITDEMVEGAKKFSQYINGIFENEDPPNLYIENHLPINYIHKDCFGTPDVFFKIDRNIHVIDYKFGFAEVEILDNFQLISYAIGVAEFFYIDISDFDDYKYHLHIVQPRLFDTNKVFKKVTVSGQYLRDKLELLKTNAELSLGLSPPSISGSHCNYCKARSVCGALEKSSFAIAETVYQMAPIVKNENELGKELKYLLQAQKLLDARVNGLMEQGLQYAKEGKKVPNFTVQQSYGREKWKGSTDEIKALGELYGVNLLKPNDLITPKQAIKAGLSAELVRLHSEILPGSIKLIEEKLEDIKKILTVKSTDV